MAVIDTLEILLTADAKGVDNVLKRTLQSVTGTINDINKQEVDWTSIFTAAVSPALISGVASVFAYAISNAVQFQAAIAQIGTAAGDNSQQIGQLSNAALGLSTQVPSSAQDIATAMTQVSAIFSNVGDQQAVVAAMAELSASGFGSLGDIVAQVVPIFKAFGVTTQDQAITVLTALMHGAEAAKETIPALAQQFIQFTPALVEAGASINNFNGLISTFSSEIKNIGAGGAQAVFKALADSSNNVVGPMELLGVNLNKVRQSLIDDGGLNAISQTSQILQRMGPSANLVATGFGFSADQIAQFDLNAKHLPQVATDAQKVAANTQTIADAYAQSDKVLIELEKDWNILKAALIIGGNAFVDLWSKALVGLNNFAAALGPVIQGINKDITSITNPLADNLTNAFTGGVNVLNKIADSISEVLKPLKDPELNNLLTGTGANFSYSQLAKIDATASNSNLVNALMSALSSGLSTQSPNYAQLHNTFNLSVPAGPGIVLTAKEIANQLYKQFQGNQ